MNYFIDLLCPNCNSALSAGSGSLVCQECTTSVPIISGIPRFVPPGNYSESFGLQWNRFAKTQLDSAQGTNRSRQRFETETSWTSQDLKDKIVLDAGCGSGRFSEIAISHGAKLIAVDYSNAVEAANKNLKSDKLLVLQGDLIALPILDQCLDYVYCIGVLQHTSHPDKIIAELLRCLRIGGELTLTFYENTSWHVKFYSKYLIRPFTKRLPNSLLLTLIEASAPIWFSVTNFLFRLPSPISKIFRFVIPIANYVEYDYPNRSCAIDEAILDTFDMLSPTYDKPIKKSEILKWIALSEFEVQVLGAIPTAGTMRFKRIS
jgi:ubiquinone/menaquinone biosynthesis C-methylase UbiE/uncharacterized protein YbaR (Trm112 family)